MKLKLLLLVLLFTSGALLAQDTIRSLVITEANLHPEAQAYIELTNMGDEPVLLSEFKLGLIEHDVVPWNVRAGRLYRLPEKVLSPGECFVIASATDFEAEQFAKGEDGYAEKLTNDRMYEVADMLVHIGELNGDETDSITPGWSGIFGRIVHGRQVLFIQQMLSETDSVVIDQVGGVFDEPDGTNITFGDVGLAGYAVAGMEGATKYAYLIRRFNVIKGNLDFANAKGVGLEDSEWIPIPRIGGPWRDIPWTLGNHGNYSLDETTLESDVLDIDYANKTITVPWGTRRGDDIMHHMVEKPGIGWVYHMSPVKEDSLSFAAATGDKIDIYVCGNDLDLATFDIVVKDPEPGANIVVPMSNLDPLGNWRGENEAGISDVEAGILDWPRVTQNESGMDTIWGARGGIPYATRIDSLLERLDKPEKANWEIVFSGMPKPDITEGDKLRVTAENGAVKDYYISVNEYRPTHNAYLSAITWPDIPNFYRGIFGWIGDTIPNFNPTLTNYKVLVPLDVDGIPALIGNPEDINSTVSVDRAKNINGAPADRTITFTVTAEDDTTQQIYNVELVKEKDPNKIQPYKADPFFSEIVFGDMWRNSYGEICNPGNQLLDLSNYMIVMDYSNNPAEVIMQTNQDNWLMRYEKYIPGYKWQTEGYWSVQTYIAEQDLNVNPYVTPGDVFCFGYISQDNQAILEYGDNWPLAKNLDVQFNNYSGRRTYSNPWGETITKDGTPIAKWSTANIYLFKIMNDSIKLGLKPATDPNDFELIDVFGMGDGTEWVVAGKSVSQVITCIRKPKIYKGLPAFAESFGTNEEDSEWINRGMEYWTEQGIPWRRSLVSISSGIGSHYMLEPTQYKSTVSSLIYKVSEGYLDNESIRGLVTGVTVSEFFFGLIKADENQSLNVKSSTNGNILNMDDEISLNDTLIVLSADSVNTTKYALVVTDEGLSSDAVLTSTRYEITIDADPKSAGDAHTPGSGSITGFEYGTALQTVVNNVTVPAGATMNVISGDGAYVPVKRLNFDTAYVSVTVNADTYFEVLAENGVTTITYQLLPRTSESEAFVLSDLYSVSQANLLIDYVPRGTNVQSFLANLVPSMGASMKLVDKWGFERMDGTVADDDKLVVTSPDGTTTKVYHISKLATQYVRETTYLAYILSNVYGIDQVEYKIHGASGIADISEFYSRIRTAPGATAVVVDSDGNEKTTGDLDGTDKVKVTSADGKIVVMYTFGPLTDANAFRVKNQIEFYPNPTSGILNVSGVEKGQRIQVYNAVGTSVLDIKVSSNRELIPLQNEPAGMYLIVVSKENQLIGRYKAIKK